MSLWGRLLLIGSLLALELGRPAPVCAEDRGPPPEIRLLPPVAESSETIIPKRQEQLIDLPTALRLAEVQNPSIGLARQAIQEAFAQQLQARAMMLPTVRAGVNYHLHQGVLQASSGLMRQVTQSSLYFGNGVGALGSATVPIPGIQIIGHLGDGLFEPLAARQLVAVRSYQAQATENQVLLDVASRFLDLARADAEIAAMYQSERDMDNAVKITAAFAKVKQGRQADAMRAQTTALLLHADTLQVEEDLAAASAELTRVLSLDPAVRLRNAGQQDAMLKLVDANRGLVDLLRQAEQMRPELAALAADVARRRVQVQQERTRPLFPTISLGFSDGYFGGGTDRTDLVPVHPQFGRFAGRVDIDAIAYWTLQNAGAGNIALVKERRAEENLASIEHERMVNVIRREVAAAHAVVLARAQDLDIARLRLRTAERAFQEDLARIKGNLGLPIELLNSINHLVRSRRDLVRIIQQYNLAQIQLFVAIGQRPLPRID